MVSGKRLAEAAALLIGIGGMVYFRANRSDGEAEPWWVYVIGLGFAAALIWYDRASSRRSD